MPHTRRVRQPSESIDSRVGGHAEAREFNTRPIRHSLNIDPAATSTKFFHVDLEKFAGDQMASRG
jgi:hypothetical protein